MAANSSEQYDLAIQQLKSSDANQRKQAVQWLARNQKREAIDTLRQLRDFDPDEEVRILAARAIRYIKEQTQTIPVVNIEGGSALLKSAKRRTGEIPAVPTEKPAPSRRTGEKPVTGSLLEAGKRRTREVPAVRVHADDDIDRSKPRPRTW